MKRADMFKKIKVMEGIREVKSKIERIKNSERVDEALKSVKNLSKKLKRNK